MVSVQGTTILVDGQAPASKFYGVVDTTALAFAILAYIEGQTQYAGRSSVFNGPDTGDYGAVAPNGNPAEFFDRYFALLSYYHCNLVRIGAGDRWATGIQYDAWTNHHDAFLSLLQTMVAAAESHNVWIVLVLAGSTEYPVFSYGGTGSVFSNTSTAYGNYITYCDGVMAALDGLPGIAWYDLFNEPDHNAVYSSYWSSNGGKSAFHSWASSVADDTRGASTHPRTMGVAGLGSMFGWGKTDFDLCTGTVPFEIASRHYYASNTDAYNFATPEAWARADGKPLYWGELAMNNVYPLVRYTFAEQAIFNNGGQAITSMVLTGTAGYPVGQETVPSASFTVTPSSGGAATVFAFDASASSDQQDASSALQVRWDWDGDGSYDTAWTTTKSATHSYAKSGTYAVTVQVANTIGFTDTATAAVTVLAASLSLSISSPADGALVNTTSVTVRWTASDSGSVIDGYSIAMDGGTVIKLGPATTSYAFTGLAQGAHVVKVSGSAADGGSASDTAAFTVDSMAPTLSITAPAANANVGSTVTMSWAGSDSGSGMSAYYIKMDSGAWIPVSSSVKSYTFSGLSSGRHTAMVRAIDAAGNIAEATVTFTVVASAPTVTITSPASGSVSASTSMPITWTGSSAGSSIASYRIRLDSGSWTTLGSSTTRYTLSGLAQGQHTVTVRAVDQAGNYKDASVTFVIDTVAPTVTINAPTSNSYVTARPTITWTAGDASSGIANFLIRSDGGTWTTLSASTTSYTMSTMTQGSHTVTVRAVDKAGNYRDASVSFRVDTTAPGTTS
jgi:PKD repeat protein